MKLKYLLMSVIMIGLTSFNNYNTKDNYTKKSIPAEYQISDGEKLISKMDCVGCHKIDKKLIGPSYLDVAKKYASNDKNINYLAGKIIKGGSGVWGAVPMAPHSTLKKEDAKSMATYILSIKK